MQGCEWYIELITSQALFILPAYPLGPFELNAGTSNLQAHEEGRAACNFVPGAASALSPDVPVVPLLVASAAPAAAAPAPGAVLAVAWRPPAALAAETSARNGPREFETICASPTSVCSMAGAFHC